MGEVRPIEFHNDDMQTAGADAKIIKGLKAMLNFWTTTHKEYRTAWEEWQAYKLEPIVGDALDDAKEMHPKEWWRNNGRSWPTLTCIIMKVHSCGCTTSPCERNWSAFKYIFNNRYTLTNTRAAKLVYVYSNLAELAKLAGAAAGPARRLAIKWGFMRG